MSVPDNIWMHFLVDKDNKSFYLDNGTVQKSSLPIPLPQHAGGWRDIKISFGTNFTYWSLNRTYSVPLFFVGDGAEIIRHYHYLGKGYEEEIYILILKKNLDTGIYELEYKGRLELSKAVDQPRKGITVPTIEGGVMSFLAANDAIEYPVKLDASNPKAIEVLFDGTNLSDRFRYSIAEVRVNSNDSHGVYTIPFPFISNEGDNVGILYGSQSLEEI